MFMCADNQCPAFQTPHFMTFSLRSFLLHNFRAAIVCVSPVHAFDFEEKTKTHYKLGEPSMRFGKTETEKVEKV